MRYYNEQLIYNIHHDYVSQPCFTRKRIISIGVSCVHPSFHRKRSQSLALHKSKPSVTKTTHFLSLLARQAQISKTAVMPRAKQVPKKRRRTGKRFPGKGRKLGGATEKDAAKKSAQAAEFQESDSRPPEKTGLQGDGDEHVMNQLALNASLVTDSDTVSSAELDYLDPDPKKSAEKLLAIMHVEPASFLYRLLTVEQCLKALKESNNWIRDVDTHTGVVWVPSMRGKNKLIPIKVVNYVNVEWMVEVMHAIAIAKSTKSRRFKLKGNKLFQIKTLLGLNPCLVVSFLAKCDPIAGYSDYTILKARLHFCAAEADALLANKAGASKPCSLK